MKTDEILEYPQVVYMVVDGEKHKINVTGYPGEKRSKIKFLEDRLVEINANLKTVTSDDWRDILLKAKKEHEDKLEEIFND